jgi:hypothetical protein
MLSSLSENKIENFNYNKEKEMDNDEDNKQDTPKPTETNMNDMNDICNKEEEGITPWRMYLRKTDSKLSLIG